MTSCSALGCKADRVAFTQFCPAHTPGASKIVCPHCQTAGKVTSREVKQKQGLSGGKVTGAVLTGGISMLGTGLSRKAKVTEMKCGNCATVWHVA